MIDWEKISLGAGLLEKLPAIKKVIKKFFKRKPQPRGPCKFFLLHGLGMIEQGRRKNNKQLIRTGVETLDNARIFYTGGMDNACFSYGMVIGYLLLGERHAAYKAVDGINGELKPYKEIQDLQKYLREVSFSKPKK